MNALDKAFIKAFAKDRSVTADERVSAATGAKTQPPVSGVDSMELVLHELYAQGSRFRVDRPTCPESVFLAAHMIVPVVEHVESYEPADISTSTLPQVVVEDRMPSLGEILQQGEKPAAALASASSKTRVRGAEKPDKQPDEPPRVLEERLELFVCPDLRMPDLGTLAFGSLAGHGEAVVTRCTTGIEIGWHAFDPELLTATPVADVDESPVGMHRRPPTRAGKKRSRSTAGFPKRKRPRSCRAWSRWDWNRSHPPGKWTRFTGRKLCADSMWRAARS